MSVRSLFSYCSLAFGPLLVRSSKLFERAKNVLERGYTVPTPCQMPAITLYNSIRHFGNNRYFLQNHSCLNRRSSANRSYLVPGLP